MPNISSIVNHAVGMAEGAVQQVTQTAQNAEASTAQGAEAAAGDAEDLVTETTEVLLGIARSMQTSGEAGLAGIKAGISTSGDVLSHIADQARWTWLLSQSALTTLAAKGAFSALDASLLLLQKIPEDPITTSANDSLRLHDEYEREKQHQADIEALRRVLDKLQEQRSKLVKQIHDLQREMLSLILRLRTNKGQIGQGIGDKKLLMGLVHQITVLIADIEFRIEQIDVTITKLTLDLRRMEGDPRGNTNFGTFGPSPDPGSLAVKLQHAAEAARGVQRLQAAQLRLAHTLQCTGKPTPKAMQAAGIIRRMQGNLHQIPKQITMPVPKARWA
jgi:hypothetical protein